ncbi:class I SAM-dependent methyltransferase, partial [bacterium]|nr:class I SAM-dependent methyltransferase [bacterium]
MNSVCDYAGYDYKKSFWDDVDRRYEDLIEHETIAATLAQYPIPNATLMDLGCGFGRLFDAYYSHARQFILLDYATNMLEQATERLSKYSDQITFIQGDARSVPLPDASVDIIVSIRTLHHLPDYERFISELHRLLRPGGIVVFEIPNFRHILNIGRFLMGRQANPFKRHVSRVGSFSNFHPQMIIDFVNRVGFGIEDTINTSFFRSGWLKKNVSPATLVRWDRRL